MSLSLSYLPAFVVCMTFVSAALPFTIRVFSKHLSHICKSCSRKKVDIFSRICTVLFALLVLSGILILSVEVFSQWGTIGFYTSTYAVPGSGLSFYADTLSLLFALPVSFTLLLVQSSSLSLSFRTSFALAITAVLGALFSADVLVLLLMLGLLFACEFYRVRPHLFRLIALLCIILGYVLVYAVTGCLNFAQISLCSLAVSCSALFVARFLLICGFVLLMIFPPSVQQPEEVSFCSYLLYNLIASTCSLYCLLRVVFFLLPVEDNPSIPGLLVCCGCLLCFSSLFRRILSDFDREATTKRSSLLAGFTNRISFIIPGSAIPLHSTASQILCLWKSHIGIILLFSACGSASYLSSVLSLFVSSYLAVLVVLLFDCSSRSVEPCSTANDSCPCKFPSGSALSLCGLALLAGVPASGVFSGYWLLFQNLIKTLSLTKSWVYVLLLLFLMLVCGVNLLTFFRQLSAPNVVASPVPVHHQSSLYYILPLIALSVALIPGLFPHIVSKKLTYAAGYSCCTIPIYIDGLLGAGSMEAALDSQAVSVPGVLFSTYTAWQPLQWILLTLTAFFIPLIAILLLSYLPESQKDENNSLLELNAEETEFSPDGSPNEPTVSCQLHSKGSAPLSEASSPLLLRRRRKIRLNRRKGAV